MTDLQQSHMGNKLLAALPPEDFEAIAPHLEPVDLPKGTVLAEPDTPVEHVYFLTNGIGSVIAVTSEGRRVEAGLFGFEGYVPAHVAAGARLSPHEVVIQVEAGGYRITFDHLKEAMETSRNLRAVIQLSVAAFTVQVSYTAASNALHSIEERLARWLLMCDDRIQGGELRLTHDYIAVMLAVRRPSVTTALHVLEGNRFVRSERGLITIRDRKSMEEFAGEAYGKPEEYYRDLMGKSM
ncbi:MAG: Crp/Fnr family transcriptional regulator [Pseudorhizobium sp.]